MINYNIYHCFNCQSIPIIKLEKDKLLIECTETKEKLHIPISSYCKLYINYLSINAHKYNFPFYFYCNLHRNYLYNGYCINCNKNICLYCKKTNHKSHKLVPDENIMKINEELKQFIVTAKNKLKNIKSIIENIEYYLFLYDALLLNENYVINYEIINNFKNLSIINNIEEKRELFQRKIDKIINELKYFENLTDINLKKENNFSDISEINLFQEPKNNLYQKNAIRIENIENKNKYIIKKITIIAQKLENFNLDKRDEFLYQVGIFAREAHNHSYILAKKLLEKFYEKKKFNSIIYERAKMEFSSWVNQSLIINDSITGIKDSRYFYEVESRVHINNFKDYQKLEKEFDNLFLKEKYNFKDLYRDLCQLYTEVLIYSEKNIELIYEMNSKYDKEKMEDITDLNGARIAKYTILPGLFVNYEPISNGKILVYCENKKFIMKLNKELPNPKTNDLQLENTIKIANISKEIKLNYNITASGGNFFKIIIATYPEIPKFDNPKFSIKLSRNNKELQSSDKNTFYINKNFISKNDNIYLSVEICGEEIKTDNIF